MGRVIEHGLSHRIVNGRDVAHIEKKFDIPNHKTYGEIPGVLNGKWWAARLEASRDGCHAPTVAGISGNEKERCWSIALSGGYEDDVDDGYCSIYTGCGGRNLKVTKPNPKNLRIAPQSSDQTLTDSRLQRPLQMSALGRI
jgi:E3 ubiquitin-protein ligase UHRF1